jgi:hypothetical protein
MTKLLIPLIPKLFTFYQDDDQQFTNDRFYYWLYCIDKKKEIGFGLKIREQYARDGIFLYPEHTKRIYVPLNVKEFDITTRSDVAQKFIKSAFLGHITI